MRRTMFLALLVAVSGSLIYDYWHQDVPGSRASDSPRSLTVTHLWATWCPPCMAEMPSLLKALSQLPPSTTLVMVSLDTDKEALEKAYKRFGIVSVREGAVHWEHDPDQSRARDLLPGFKVPATVIQDETGRVRHIHNGSLDWPSFIPLLNQL